MNILFHSLFDGDGDSDRCTDHGVVAHAYQAHHLYVGGDGGGARELSVAVHSSHSIGHAIAGRTGSHVVGMERSARAAAGRDAARNKSVKKTAAIKDIRNNKNNKKRLTNAVLYDIMIMPNKLNKS